MHTFQLIGEKQHTGTASIVGVIQGETVSDLVYT